MNSEISFKSMLRLTSSYVSTICGFSLDVWLVVGNILGEAEGIDVGEAKGIDVDIEFVSTVVCLLYIPKLLAFATSFKNSYIEPRLVKLSSSVYRENLASASAGNFTLI